MKRLVIACDGTWQDLEQKTPTNVRLIAKAVQPLDGATQQLVYYAPGIGTRSVFEKYVGGAFGAGINVEIAAAYTFLCSNYNLGDEIYLFGFSRGAYTVRSLAGLIAACGILKRHEIDWLPNAYALYRRLGDEQGREEVAQRLQVEMGHGQTSADPANSAVRIKFLGVWDTVGSLGIPDLSGVIKLDRESRRKNQFHDTFLSPIIDYARHAVAIDERRRIFYHTEMNLRPGDTLRDQQLRQVWFPGDHGAVGGGDRPKKPYSDAALGWMVDELDQIGRLSNGSSLRIDRRLLGLAPNPLADLQVKNPGMFNSFFKRRLSDPLAEPQPLDPKKDRRPFCRPEDVHASAMERWRGVGSYRPKNLADAMGDQLG